MVLAQLVVELTSHTSVLIWHVFVRMQLHAMVLTSPGSVRTFHLTVLVPTRVCWHQDLVKVRVLSDTGHVERAKACTQQVLNDPQNVFFCVIVCFC